MLGKVYLLLLVSFSHSALSLHDLYPLAAFIYLLSSDEAVGELQGLRPHPHPSLTICSQTLCGWQRER